MRIIHLAAGAGAMYCGACARDAALLRGLIRRGHDVQVVQLYTPLRLEEDGFLEHAPIYLGGINAYLQQISSLFRVTPLWIDRLFDSPALLRWAAAFAVRTQPEQLGPMTVSVLQGREGRQRKELEKLISYLEGGPRPDVVCITNSLLSGIAPEIKRRMKTPIVCAFQGEDYFIEAMPEPYAARARQLMRENARSIDLFLSPGQAYAEKMEAFLGVEPGRVRLTRVGLEANAFRREGAPSREPFVLGYLSVIAPRKGLDILLEAFLRLRARQPGIVLRVAGKVLDSGYWKEIERRVRQAKAEEAFEYLGEVTFAEKVRFLHACHLFCVPSRIAESRGHAVMEAMAAGAPVVAPDTGIFPEMLALTGGGVLFESGNGEDLARVLGELISDHAKREVLGAAGAQGIACHFTAEAMVETALAHYTSLIKA